MRFYYIYSYERDLIVTQQNVTELAWKCVLDRVINAFEQKHVFKTKNSYFNFQRTPSCEEEFLLHWQGFTAGVILQRMAAEGNNLSHNPRLAPYLLATGRRHDLSRWDSRTFLFNLNPIGRFNSDIKITHTGQYLEKRNQSDSRKNSMVSRKIYGMIKIIIFGMCYFITWFNLGLVRKSTTWVFNILWGSVHMALHLYPRKSLNVLEVVGVESCKALDLMLNYLVMQPKINQLKLQPRCTA